MLLLELMTNDVSSRANESKSDLPSSEVKIDLLQIGLINSRSKSLDWKLSPLRAIQIQVIN